MKTKIYLIRHGETDWNKEKRYHGQKDIPLNSLGKLQADELADKFYKESISLDSIYSSNLQRAKETAFRLASKYDLEVQVIEDLKERYFGDLEGINIEELKKDNPNFDVGKREDLEYYNVEPFEMLKSRIYNSIKCLTEKHVEDSIAVISHAASINSFLFEVSQGRIGTGLTKIKNTSVITVVFDHRNKTWKVKE